MTHATETARRENLRDVWSQKTRKAGQHCSTDAELAPMTTNLVFAETLMITNTLMFGCFFGVLVEGLKQWFFFFFGMHLIGHETHRHIAQSSVGMGSGHLFGVLVDLVFFFVFVVWHGSFAAAVFIVLFAAVCGLP